MEKSTQRMLAEHVKYLFLLEMGEIPMHISWKLVEVGQGFLSGYKEVYLATQLLQEAPSALAMLEFARELHECLAKAFKADPGALVFVLSTVSVTRKGEAPDEPPCFKEFAGDQPPPDGQRPPKKKCDSDVEIDLGPEA